MTATEAKAILDQIVGQIFGYKNPLSLEQFMQKYAFDVRLPSQVSDSTTGEITWASSINPTKFMTLTNARESTKDTDNMLPKRPVNSIEDILAVWNETNYRTTERYLESINVHESDCVTGSENVYRSQDITRSKNVVFSDGAVNCEYVAGVQRTIGSTFSVRTEDSQNISGSFSVSWSNKISNSFFISDCFDLMDCMFCTNIAGKQFCIANMQFEEAEYKKIKDLVVRWILTN